VVRIFKHFVPSQLLALVVADGLVVFASMYLGIMLRFLGTNSDGYLEHLPIYPRALIFVAVMLVSMTAMGLYLRESVSHRMEWIPRLMASFGAGLAIMTLIMFAVRDLSLWRGPFGLSVILAFLGTILTRVVFIRIVGSEVLKQRLLVLGTGSRAQQIESILRDNGIDDKFEIVGYVPGGETQHAVPEGRLIGVNKPLIATCFQNQIDEIVVAVRDRRRGNLAVGELLECKLEGFDVVEIGSFFERETGHVQLDTLNPSWMVFSDGFCRSSSRNFVKRSFDVLVSLVLLLASIPVMLLAAFAIWIESGRPIFYRQTRVGECGEVFEILKFRSMRVDAEQDGKAQWATKNDTRVTRVGRILRDLRIDELPQIFNVLKGDMSFVGPRPERPAFTSGLSKSIPFYRNRLSVKPGITGWAQINYPYGASSEDARRKLQYDLYYVKNHSLFLDVVILLQTVNAVLFARGAR